MRGAVSVRASSARASNDGHVAGLMHICTPPTPHLCCQWVLVCCRGGWCLVLACSLLPS